MDALGLPENEAVQDAIETLQQQGFDLSRVITSAPPPGGREESTASKLSQLLSAEVHIDEPSSSINELMLSLKACIVRVY